MASYKKISELQEVKIKLLEEFITESARLADINGWITASGEIIELERLSKELDKITEEIENLQK